MTRAELLLELTGVIQAAQRADETARALEAAEAERDEWMKLAEEIGATGTLKTDPSLNAIVLTFTIDAALLKLSKDRHAVVDNLLVRARGHFVNALREKKYIL